MLIENVSPAFIIFGTSKSVILIRPSGRRSLKVIAYAGVENESIKKIKHASSVFFGILKSLL
jgi:hypothetical protein